MLHAKISSKVLKLLLVTNIITLLIVCSQLRPPKQEVTVITFRIRKTVFAQEFFPVWFN